MNKLKITLLAATIAGGLALSGGASAAPFTTQPLAAPTNLVQVQATAKQTASRKKVRRHRYARYHRYYGPYGYYGYPYGYGYPYYRPGLWFGVPGFGFGLGW